MTRKDVRHLLGEPLQLQRNESSEKWIYRYDVVPVNGQSVDGMVAIDPFDGRVLWWTEPDWEMLNRVKD